jgi:hypothetical protein
VQCLQQYWALNKHWPRVGREVLIIDETLAKLYLYWRLFLTDKDGSFWRRQAFNG